jgi:hypothetical protein
MLDKNCDLWDVCEMRNGSREGLEPAASIIEALGGFEAVGKIIGVQHIAVWRWTQPKSKRRGTGGLIPAQHQRALLEYAEAHGLPVTAEMIIRGGEASADRCQVALRTKA